LERDSAMPVKTEPPDFGCHPIDAIASDAAATCINRLIALVDANDQSPHVKAILGRDVAKDFTDIVGFCFRKLEISPWGDDERAAFAAEGGPETKARD
jgi:hypothetical protein